jgi:tetratricopeptide (TPR) repeat protein
VLSPDGPRIAVAPLFQALSLPRGGDGSVRLYDARTGQPAVTLPGPAPLVQPAFCPPDGARVAATGGDGRVHIFDVRSGQKVLALEAGEPLGRLAFSPDGARVAVAPRNDNGDAVQLYDAATGHEVHALRGPAPPDRLTAPAFSPDGLLVAVRGSDGAARVYDVRSGQIVLTLKGPVALNAPSFSPDGGRIAVGGDDGVVRVYDARSGQETLALKGPTTVAAPVFSADGLRLVVAPMALRDPAGARVWTAPRDAAAWQAERREALAAGMPAWHRARAEELTRAGQWFAAGVHLDRLVAAQPQVGRHYLRRGQALAARGKTDEAKQDFEKALSLSESLSLSERATAQAELGRWDDAGKLYASAVAVPGASAEVWSRHALLCLYREGRTGYCTACAALLGRFGKSRDSSVVAATCTLGPAALADLRPAVELARGAVRAGPRDANRAGVLGAILYRAGVHAEAVSELIEAVKINTDGGTARDFLFLAMAHHQIGKTDEARSWLEKATQAHAKQPPVSWTERLEWQLLHREAEALLKEPPPAPKK